MTTVAVLGTGKMGAGMARQLLQHGHTVRVWNRSQEKAASLAEHGAMVSTDPAEAVRGAEVVLTMLFDARSVVDVLDQAAPGLGEHVVLVQCTTVGLDLPRVVEAAERAGLPVLDAPVLGTRTPAEDGTLVVLASGDPAVREAAEPVLEAIGSRTVWAGEELGAASRLKLVCNAFVATLTTATAQSVALAEGLGLDPDLFLDAIRGGASDAAMVHAKSALMTAGDYPPAFDLAGMSKDLRLIRAAAEQAGVATVLPDALLALAQRALDAGRGGEDMAVVRTAFGPST